MQRFDDFVRTLLSGAQQAGQQASTPFPPRPTPQPAPMPTPAPLPAPPPPPVNPAIQQVAQRAMQVMDPTQFARDLGMQPEPPRVQGFMQPQQEEEPDYSGDWVVVDAGSRADGMSGRKVVVMPAANAIDVPEDAILGRISNEPDKVKKAQEQGLLLSQQDEETQLVFQTKAQHVENLATQPSVNEPSSMASGKAAPGPVATPSTPPNALGQTPEQVFAGEADFNQLQQDLRTKSPETVVREQGGADYDITDLTTQELRKTDPAKAGLLENNGIFRVGTGEMVVREADGTVRKVPYQGEDQEIPGDWEIITYGGKEQDPSELRDAQRGGIRIPIVSDLTGIELPSGPLPNAVVDVLNLPSGAASATLTALSAPQQISVGSYTDFLMTMGYDRNPGVAKAIGGVIAGSPLSHVPGFPAYNQWLFDNPEEARKVYEGGYTDPKTGETFTGGRAVWERFQADRNVVERGADVVLTDPLTAATGGTGEGVTAVGQAVRRIPGVGRAVAPVLEETGRFVDDVGREVNAGVSSAVDLVKRGAGKAIRPTEGSRVAVGSEGRAGQREVSSTVDDLLGQNRQERRDIGADLPVAAPDLTQPGSRRVDLGSGNYALAGYGDNPAWTVYGPDGAKIVDRGTWDDVVQSEPYQAALRERGTDPRDLGFGDETAPAPERVPVPRERVRAGDDDLLPDAEPGRAETPPVVREEPSPGPARMPEPSPGQGMVELVPDSLYAERSARGWDVYDGSNTRLANDLPWNEVDRQFVPDELEVPSAVERAVDGQAEVPELKAGADRTEQNLTPDAMPTADSELQRELRQRLEHTEYLRPQTREARAAAGRAVRATDRVIELADQYPERAAAFVDEYTPRAERATQRNIERRGRGQWIENTPGTQDGFAVKKALNRVEDAEHYVDDILPLHGKHFGDVEPAPDYAWETKPAKTESAYRRNLKNQSPDQLVERYIFDERENHASAARQVLEDKFIYERDANGQYKIGADGQKIPKSANATILKRTLDRAAEVRERYISSRIASDENAVRAVDAPAPAVEELSPREQMGSVTSGQREVLAGTNRRQPLRAPRRIGGAQPAARDTAVEAIPGVDRGVARATDLDSPTNDFYWRNAVVSDSQARVLKQTFADGERFGDRFDRYVDEIMAETPKQQQKRLASGEVPSIADSGTKPAAAITAEQAEQIARDRVLAEWGYENLTAKGKARADEWYAKLRKTTNDEAAREQAVRRAMSSESGNKLLRAYDRAARTLRGTILYNVVSAPRTILQQTVGNSLTLALQREPEAMKAALSPKAIREGYAKLRASSADDLVTEMDRARDGWGLRGRREHISGDISTRDQVDVSIDAQYNRRTREARTKLGWKDFNVFTSRSVRDMAGAQDLVAREALWTSFMDRITLDGRASLRDQMLARKPKSMATEEFDALFDSLPSRFSADDIRATFGDHGQTWADRGARDWQELLVKGDRSAAAEVKRILFDGTMTNADDIARRFVFFHYWMSRAMPMYTAMIARDPVYLLNYARMMEAMEKENNASSLVDDGFIAFMKSPFGYQTAIRPDVFWPTFKDAWDGAGYEPDGENSLGKLMRKVGFMPHPVFGTALNMLGMMGDTFAPDPTGTGRLRRLATEGVDYYKTLTGSGDATPTRDPSNDLLLKGRAWITAHLDWVPGVDEVPYRDSMVFTEREITNLMVDIAKEGGIDTESDAFIAAVDDPNSELRRQAFDRWSKQNALDVGLSLSPAGVFYPKSTLISPKERNEAATNMREEREGTSYSKALPAEQAVYDENEIANTPNPEARELKTLQNQYQGLGTGRQRAGMDFYNSIRFGYTEEVIYAGGYEWTPTQIAGFGDEDREVLADLWAEEAGYAEDISALQDARKEFRGNNPAYADYVAWAGSVRDYEGGPEKYWQDTARGNPNAERWYADNPEEAGLTSVDAYLAQQGVASSYRDPEPIATRDMANVPYSAAETATGGSSSSGFSDRPSGPTREGIQKGIAEYQQRKKEYLDLIEQLWGQRVDPDMMDPNTRSAVVTILRDNYGVEAPYVSGQTKGYLEWAAAQEGPSGIDDYLRWYEQTQAANPAPTGAEIESVTPEDAASVLAH